MRIAVITGEYPPMEGGVGAFTAHLSHSFQTGGHAVHIVTTEFPGEPPVHNDESGLTVHRAIRSWGPSGLGQLRALLRKVQPDVVNIQYEPAAYAMRGSIHLAPCLLRQALRVPFVVTFHDLLPPYLFPGAGPLRQRSVWHLARSAQGVIATNHEDLESLNGVMRGSPTRTRLIPIGSNISASPPPNFDRDTWRTARGYRPADIVVGFFGFLNRTKGIETLLDAIAELEAQGLPVHLLFIGGRTGTSDVTNAGYAAEVDALIKDLELESRVQWTGFASPEEVSAALIAIDVCALPYRDGANLRHGTLHAALAHGCPIVTTAPPAPIPELKDGANVLFIPSGDAHALAQAIQTLTHDATLRAELGRGASALAARFTWPQIASETAAFFAALTTGAASTDRRRTGPQ